MFFLVIGCGLMETSARVKYSLKGAIACKKKEDAEPAGMYMCVNLAQRDIPPSSNARRMIT